MQERTDEVAQVVEHLPKRYEVVSSSPLPPKTNKQTNNKNRCTRKKSEPKIKSHFANLMANLS
jgi:hypothetical protein